MSITKKKSARSHAQSSTVDLCPKPINNRSIINSIFHIPHKNYGFICCAAQQWSSSAHTRALAHTHSRARAWRCARHDIILLAGGRTGTGTGGEVRASMRAHSRSVYRIYWRRIRASIMHNNTGTLTQQRTHIRAHTLERLFALRLSTFNTRKTTHILWYCGSREQTHTNARLGGNRPNNTHTWS